jgi:hypothetical protein
MSLEEVASWILRFAQLVPHTARNAYSAFLHIPGWESLKFSQQIRLSKRFWNVSEAKYSDFWDAKSVVERLKKLPVNWSSVQQVRDRCILILRLFHLCRSVDLSQACRTRAPSGAEVYWLIKRKGRPRATFEQLINLPDRTISPKCLLLHYVSLTAGQGTPGGPVFLSLHPPFKALSANSIGRITKKLLAQLGVPVSVFGPHSTRGAGVKMLKDFGLPSEVVCELGSWKNSEAFSKHYLRLGAAKTVANVLVQKFVHKVPSCQRAETGVSRSPGTDRDTGRRDPPGEAQRQDGPTPPSQGSTKTGGGPLTFRFADPADRRRRPSSKDRPTAQKTQKQ